MSWHSYGPYVSAAERKANAANEMAKRAMSGKKVDPVIIEGRQIAKTFWGLAWCSHIEILSDFASRLEKGKRYARNGSVVHLEISKGKIEAIVKGSELYEITIEIQPISNAAWTRIKQACAGHLTSAVELLQGKFSDATMKILTDPDSGMFPHADDFDTDCSCPDFVRLCKHLAAVLYGVGARLDRSPELLFTLRGVDPTELLSGATTFAATQRKSKAATLKQDELSDVFGIDLADEPVALVPLIRKNKTPRPAPNSTASPAKKAKAKKAVKKRVTTKKKVSKSLKAAKAKGRSGGRSEAARTEAANNLPK